MKYQSKFYVHKSSKQEQKESCFYLLMQSKTFEKRYKCVNRQVSRQDTEHSSQER
jgi:hypothetical protein